MKVRSGFNSPKCSSLIFKHFNVHRIVIWGSLPEWADGTTVADSLTFNSFSCLNAFFWAVFKRNHESVASCTCCHVVITIGKHSREVCRHCCALTIKLGVLLRWNINVSIYLVRWIGRLKSVSDVAMHISESGWNWKKSGWYISAVNASHSAPVYFAVVPVSLRPTRLRALLLHLFADSKCPQ